MFMRLYPLNPRIAKSSFSQLFHASHIKKKKICSTIPVVWIDHANKFA